MKTEARQIPEKGVNLPAQIEKSKMSGSENDKNTELNPGNEFSKNPVFPKERYAGESGYSEMDQEEEEFAGTGIEEESEDKEFYEHYRLIVDPGQSLMRVDVWLAHTLRNTSRSKIKRAADAGCLLVNGSQVKPSYKIKPADEIVLLLPYPPPPDIEPENIPVQIAFEDDDICLVNKDAGMVVHPGVGNWYGTLVHALLYYFNGPTARRDDENVIWPKLVHRIDKDTSGLLLVSKSDESMFALSQQFYEHTTDRNYWAIVWGDVLEDKGTISGHIGRHKKDRKKFAVYTDGSVGKHAVTHFEVMDRFGIATLVRCKLETGRTHQIRVHLKHIGHTLFGDTMYGGDVVLAGPNNTRSYLDFIFKCLKTMPRQALHAKTLGFTHPISKERVNFESELPQDFEDLLGLLTGYREKMNPA